MTWQELVVSVEAAVLLLPVHLLIVHAFRLIQPSVPLEPPPAAAKGLPTSGPSKPAPAVAHIQQVRLPEQLEPPGLPLNPAQHEASPETAQGTSLPTGSRLWSPKKGRQNSVALC